MTPVTVFPAGSVAALVTNTCVLTVSRPPDEVLRYGVVSATVLPDCTEAEPPFRVQSEKDSVTLWLVPSLKCTVAVPVEGPLVAAPRKAMLPEDPDTATVWPLAW